MQFTVPATKTDMYRTLKEIFYYYRIKRAEYEEVTLNKLNIAKEVYTEPTAEEYESKAKTLCAPSQEIRLAEYKDGLKKQISVLEKKKTGISAALAKTKAQIEQTYTESEEKVKSEADKKGLADSSIVLSELAKLSEQKVDAVASATDNSESEIAQVDAEISALNTLVLTANTKYSSVCEKEVAAKIIELKEKESERKKSTDRYNASASEKEQRYENNLKEVQASLKLKYISIINASEYTKDQLVDMGYYQDVMDCVCGYYDTLSAADAYTDIKSESKLGIYLEDYYINVMYMYKSRAGV